MTVQEFTKLTFHGQMIKIIDKKSLDDIENIELYESSILVHCLVLDLPEEYLNKVIYKVASYLDIDDGLNITGQGIELYV